MEGVTNNPKDFIERQFKDGVAEPEAPTEFLLKLLGRTKDDPYTALPAEAVAEGEAADSLRAKLPERRARMERAFAQMSDVSAEILAAYGEACKTVGFTPGEVRMYIVGGRVREKPLLHTSDIDVVFTTKNAKEGLQPDFSSDDPDLVKRKQKARAEFVKLIPAILEKYDLLERDSEGNVEGWFLEPKGYGSSEAETRKKWTEQPEESGRKRIAILVNTVSIS